MLEIQYPTNPNSDTAFVVRDDGKKNRALMVAPQDTSTLELSDNPNSTKGYVTVDGKKHRVNLVVDLGGGGGGSVDTSKVVNADVLPTADASSAGKYYLYTGATTAEYTQNYIYKNVKTATYTGTVSFEPATLSGTTVTCSGDNFANFLTESGVEPLSVVSGTMTFDSASDLWALVGKDSDGNTVLTFQEYQQDFVDAGFTFTGTPQDGDVVAFTCTVEEASATYAWTRVDVQPAPVIPDPLPSQTGNAGKFLTTDGTDASWSDKAITNNTTKTNSLAVFPSTETPSASSVGTNAVLIGRVGSSLGPGIAGDNAVAIGCRAPSAGAYGVGINGHAGRYSIAIGNASGSDQGNHNIMIGADNWGSNMGKTYGIAIGCNTGVSESNTIQFNVSGSNAYNSDANTFKVANANGNFELMSADGTVPTARLTKVNTTATLAAADWSSNTQTVTVSGVKADSVVFVSPAPASASDYVSAGILCTSQSADSLTFTATTTPSVAIDVNIICL